MLIQKVWYPGDEVSWQTEEVSNYPSVSWSLIVHIVGPTTASFSGSLVSDVGGSGWNATASSAVTVNFTTSGSYAVYESVTSAAIRHTLYVTTIDVKDNPETVGKEYDPRSHIRRIRDSIRAVMEGRATKSDEAIAIAGRSLSRTPLADLVKMLNLYNRLVDEEDQAERISKGLPSGRSIVTRFRRA